MSDETTRGAQMKFICRIAHRQYTPSKVCRRTTLLVSRSKRRHCSYKPV